MGLFDRLFRKSGRSESKLDEFLSQIDRNAIPTRASFDAAAFETAAFIHYCLLAKHLGSLGDESGDVDDEDTNEAVCCHVPSGIGRSHP